MINKYEIRGDVTAIFLNRKDGTVMETLISTSDLQKMKTLSSWYAHYQPVKDVFYVIGNDGKRNGKHIKFYAHRYLTDAPKGLVVDHINHKTLDNRKENLRVVTTLLNAQNRKGATKHNLSSGVRGVSWYKNYQKWVAYCKYNGKIKRIGYFDTIEEADKAVKEVRAKHMPGSQEALAN